jgi:dephospho-CoA kinase
MPAPTLMKVLGLTGGVGMGKSATAELLPVRAIPVIDTDELARLVVEPGQPALAEIRAEFGQEIFNSDGTLERKALARLVFSDTNARQKLERILHPRIRHLWREQMQTWRGQGIALAVVVIPLLFETGAETELDATICVACSKTTQLERLSARGWNSEQMEQRINAQWSIDKKMAKANFVIWTEGNIEITALQLDRILHVQAPRTTQTSPQPDKK